MILPSTRNALAALALALLVPAAAPAQTRASPALSDGLSNQDREMLAMAQDFSRRCGEILERWVANKEVAEERLFSFLYYPVARTDPPKFITDYDKLSDRDILPVEEGVLARSATMIYAVMVDKFGYLPTHNKRYSEPLTGNYATDLLANRTKRIFNDKTGIAAAKSRAPFLVQRYQRDTGENLVDLSVPVMVKGQQWGAVRLGYRQVDSQ